MLLQCLVEVRAHKQREETLSRARFNTQGRGDGKTGLKELGGGGGLWAGTFFDFWREGLVRFEEVLTFLTTIGQKLF